jgi:hypothetical protein
VTLAIGGLLFYVAARDWGLGWASAFALGCAVIAISIKLLGKRRSDVAAVISGPRLQDERRRLIALKAGSAANKVILTVGSVAYVVSMLSDQESERMAPAFAGMVSVAALTYVTTTWWYSRRG